jgi:hypothetical protein
MLGRMYLLAGAMCVSSYALALSPSIGSVTARGETKIDNYEVRGSGTVFDGSVVETGQSISSEADLRLANDAKVTLWRDSRGTLYSDHLVLERGTAQLGSTDSFSVQANGLVVVPVEAHSSGVISIDPAKSVTVDAKDGTLEIRNSSGAGVARVRAGHPLTFSSVNGKSPADFSAMGKVSSEKGRYYLDSSETCMKYEVKGDNLQSYDGASVVASGVLEAAEPTAGIAGIILANSIRSSNAGLSVGESTQMSTLVRGWSIAKPISLAVPATQSTCPPSPLQDCCPGVPLPKCCVPLAASKCSHSQ